MKVKSHGHTSDKEAANLSRKNHNKSGCVSWSREKDKIDLADKIFSAFISRTYRTYARTMLWADSGR
jgi:hypothetical protein